MSQQRSVFITGGAAGIGAEVAKRFLSLGWRVGIYDISDVDVNDFPQAKGPLVTGKLDVTNAEQWKTALAEFCGESGTLDVLVNNAGILASGSFEDIDLARQQEIININVGGTLNGCYLAHEYLAATPGATIVNMSSASAIYGQPDLVAYSASKFGVRGLTEALELEWHDQDIRVIALWPLFVSTNMVVGMENGATKSLGIRLTAEDVAMELVNAVRNPSKFGRVHYSVGAQTKVLANLAKIPTGRTVASTNASLPAELVHGHNMTGSNT